MEAEQTTRQPAEQLEERRRQTQELVAQAQQQDVQQVHYGVCSSSSGRAVVACAHMLACTHAWHAHGSHGCVNCILARIARSCSPQEAFSMDAPDLNTDDESNEVEEYEAWRARELHRIARDR